MSRDIPRLIAKSGPDALTPPDMSAVRATVRRRAVRRRIVGGITTLSVMAVGLVALNPLSQSQDSTFVVSNQRVVRPIPATADSRAPSDFAVVQSSRRLLVWARTLRADPAGRWASVFDMRSGTWEHVVRPPLPNRPLARVSMAEGRILVCCGNRGEADAAVYSIDSRRWNLVPQVRLEGVSEIIPLAWTGSTLVAAGFSAGVEGWHVLRWNFGQESWVRGERPPASTKRPTEFAADQSRIAVVSSTMTDHSNMIMVYRIETDEWVSNELEIDGRVQSLGWVEDKIVVVASAGQHRMWSLDARDEPTDIRAHVLPAPHGARLRRVPHQDSLQGPGRLLATCGPTPCAPHLLGDRLSWHELSAASSGESLLVSPQGMAVLAGPGGVSSAFVDRAQETPIALSALDSPIAVGSFGRWQVLVGITVHESVAAWRWIRPPDSPR